MGQIASLSHWLVFKMVHGIQIEKITPPLFNVVIRVKDKVAS